MSDRPTPITDEIDTNQKSRSWESSYWNMRDHARDLERQLAEAREQRDHYLAESNQLAEELKQERGASFREQRDRLAEALRKVIYEGRNSVPEALAALAAVKGGSQ